MSCSRHVSHQNDFALSQSCRPRPSPPQPPSPRSGPPSQRSQQSREAALIQVEGGPWGCYQFRQTAQHEYAKPPAMMPTPMPSMPDNQAPIIPPTAKLASNQKIQIAKLRTTAISPPKRRGGSDLSEGVR